MLYVDLMQASQTVKHAPDQLDPADLRPLLLRAIDRVGLTLSMSGGEVTVRHPYPDEPDSGLLAHVTVTFPVYGQDILTEFYLMMAGD